MRNCLFVGGGPIEGWRAIADDLETVVARWPETPATLSPYADDATSPLFRAITCAPDVLYSRRRFGGHSITGRTRELVIIDGWLLPRRQDGLHEVFTPPGYEPTVRTITEEVFWRTPGVKISGPWDH